MRHLMDPKGGVVGIHFILKHLSKHPRRWRCTASFRLHFLAVGGWARNQIRHAYSSAIFCVKNSFPKRKNSMRAHHLRSCVSLGWRHCRNYGHLPFRLCETRILGFFITTYKKKIALLEVWTRYSATPNEHYTDGGFKSRYNLENVGWC